MAVSDYYLCDLCGNKCFYDANLNYKFDSKTNPIAEDKRVRGTHISLDYCGDMGALCLNCAKTHEVVIMPLKNDS